MKKFRIIIIFYYQYNLKHNNYNITSEKLFNEANVNFIFNFPQDVKDEQNESEELFKRFFQYFYYNSYFNSDPPNDTTADFWNYFWEIFSKKMKNGNQYNSLIDDYIEKQKKKPLF